MTVVATIGTTHPLGLAGLVFCALALADDGVRPVCIVAGVSAQDASSVTARTAIEPSTIRAQFEALHDANVGAFHVGALLSADAVRAVAAGLAAAPHIPTIVDPVLATSTGAHLADDETRAAIRDALIPRATLLTPNLDEAGALTGKAVDDVAAMRKAAEQLIALGARSVLIKGGHLAGNPVDVYSDGKTTTQLPAKRIEKAMRGTGDLLAVTIAACVARGAPMPEAIERARQRVRDAIARSVPFANTTTAIADREQQ